jgi:hypothetical protein
MLRAREVMKKKAVSKVARGKLAKAVVFSGRKETLASWDVVMFIAPKPVEGLLVGSVALC